MNMESCEEGFDYLEKLRKPEKDVKNVKEGCKELGRDQIVGTQGRGERQKFNSNSVQK